MVSRLRTDTDWELPACRQPLEARILQLEETVRQQAERIQQLEDENFHLRLERNVAILMGDLRHVSDEGKRYAEQELAMLRHSLIFEKIWQFLEDPSYYVRLVAAAELGAKTVKEWNELSTDFVHDVIELIFRAIQWLDDGGDLSQELLSSLASIVLRGAVTPDRGIDAVPRVLFHWLAAPLPRLRVFAAQLLALMNERLENKGPADNCASSSQLLSSCTTRNVFKRAVGLFRACSGGTPVVQDVCRMITIVKEKSTEERESSSIHQSLLTVLVHIATCCSSEDPPIVETTFQVLDEIAGYLALNQSGLLAHPYYKTPQIVPHLLQYLLNIETRERFERGAHSLHQLVRLLGNQTAQQQTMDLATGWPETNPAQAQLQANITLSHLFVTPLLDTPDSRADFLRRLTTTVSQFRN